MTYEEMERAVSDCKQSVVELAETQKEMVRIIQTLHKEESFNISDHVVRRLTDVYNKCSRAKNRMDV